MLLFGLSTALLGALMPVLAARLNFHLSRAGTLFLVLNLGVFLCVFGLGRWIDRRGVRAPLSIGPALLAAALLLVQIATSFAALLAAALLLGLGGGALNVATNTLVAELHPDPRAKNSALNRLGLYFGIGALMVPLGLGALLGRAGAAPVLLGAAALSVAVVVYSARVHYPAPRHAGLPRQPLAGPRTVLLLTAALLFLQSGGEVILAGYTTSLLVSDLHMNVATAQWGLTVMWVAVLAARAVLIRVALIHSGHRIVMASLVLTLAGCAALIWAGSPVAAFAALALLGAGMAAIFPTVLGMTGTLFRSSPGAVFGLLLTVSRLGAMAMPYGAGWLGERSGARAVVWIVLAGTLAMLVLESARQRSTLERN
jgi:fucose permease